MCIDTGWIAGQIAIEDLDRLTEPEIEVSEIRRILWHAYSAKDTAATSECDRLLREFQTLMFDYGVTMWKHESRLHQALDALDGIKSRFAPRIRR